MVPQAVWQKGHIASNSEWYSPNRQDRHFPFVSGVVPPQHKKQGQLATIQFKISSTVKKTYKVLLEGGTKAFIDHI